MTKLPDTSEAVAKALYETPDEGYAWELNAGEETRRSYLADARVAIAAHEADLARQGIARIHKDDVAPNDAWIRWMNEQGCVLVKPVKIHAASHSDTFSAQERRGWNMALAELQARGAAIEVIE